VAQDAAAARDREAEVREREAADTRDWEIVAARERDAEAARGRDAEAVREQEATERAAATAYQCRRNRDSTYAWLFWAHTQAAKKVECARGGPDLSEIDDLPPPQLVKTRQTNRGNGCQQPSKKKKK